MANNNQQAFAVVARSLIDTMLQRPDEIELAISVAQKTSVSGVDMTFCASVASNDCSPGTSEVVALHHEGLINLYPSARSQFLNNLASTIRRLPEDTKSYVHLEVDTENKRMSVNIPLDENALHGHRNAHLVEADRLLNQREIEDKREREVYERKVMTAYDNIAHIMAQLPKDGQERVLRALQQKG